MGLPESARRTATAVPLHWLVCILMICCSHAQLSAEEKNKPAVVIATLQSSLHKQKVTIAALESTVTRLTEQLDAAKKESLGYRLELEKLSHRVEELADTAEQLGFQVAHAESAKLACASSADGDRRKHDDLAAELSRCRAREARAVAAEVNATSTATRLADELHMVQQERNDLHARLHLHSDAVSDVAALQHALREKKRQLLALEAVWERRLYHHVAEHHHSDKEMDEEVHDDDVTTTTMSDRNDPALMHALVSDEDVDAMAIPPLEELASLAAAAGVEGRKTFLNILKADEHRYREDQAVGKESSSSSSTDSSSTTDSTSSTVVLDGLVDVSDDNNAELADKTVEVQAKVQTTEHDDERLPDEDQDSNTNNQERTKEMPLDNRTESTDSTTSPSSSAGEVKSVPPPSREDAEVSVDQSEKLELKEQLKKHTDYTKKTTKKGAAASSPRKGKQ